MTKAADLSFDACLCSMPSWWNPWRQIYQWLPFHLFVFGLQSRTSCGRRQMYVCPPFPSFPRLDKRTESERGAGAGEGGGEGRKAKAPLSLLLPSLFLLYCSHRRLPLLSPFLLTCGLVHESACSSKLCVSAIWVGKIGSSRLTNQVRLILYFDAQVIKTIDGSDGFSLYSFGSGRVPVSTGIVVLPPLLHWSVRGGPPPLARPKAVHSPLHRPLNQRFQAWVNYNVKWSSNPAPTS